MRRAAGVALAVVLLFAVPASLSAASPAYPDLRTLTPSDLRFDSEYLSGSWHWVMRFSNTVWNGGEGRLGVRGATVNEKTRVYQRVYDGSSYTEHYVGDFIWHSAHNHFHFENFAEYQLWTRSEYQDWIASGRSVGQARKRGTKTTFCIMDTRRVQALAGSPTSPFYSGCGNALQGLSVGWGDTYGYSLAEQWIDLGSSKLSNGYYVLRSVADPRNQLYESANKSSATREGDSSNEAVRYFRVKNGRIR